MPDISEVHVPRERHCADLNCMRSNLLVRGRRQPNVTCELHLVPQVLQHDDYRTRQIGIDQKSHAKLIGWQGVKRFLLSQLAHKS